MDTAAFERALGDLINRHSMENRSDTPDYMLANYLARCLEAYNATVRAREEWYGRTPKPDGGNGDVPEPMPHGDCRTCGWNVVDDGGACAAPNLKECIEWWDRDNVAVARCVCIRLPGAPPCPGWKRRDNNTEKE